MGTWNEIRQHQKDEEMLHQMACADAYRRYDDAGDAAHAALRTMLRTMPTTLAGTLALLQYIAVTEDEGGGTELQGTYMDLDENAPGREHGYDALLKTLITGLTPLASTSAA